MTVPTNHPTDDVDRAPRTMQPWERVALDWWQMPSVAPTRPLQVDSDDRHLSALAAVAGSWPRRNVTAQLFADPDHGQDRHAVSVLLDGYEVGHLPRDRDPRFTAIVNHLATTQGPVRVRARIHGGSTSPWGLVVHAHPECFDPGRHFLAGDQELAVECTPEHHHLVADLGPRTAVAARLGLDESDLSTLAPPRLTVAVHEIRVGVVQTPPPGLLALVRAALARGVAPTCEASSLMTDDGAVALRLRVSGDLAELRDICL